MEESKQRHEYRQQRDGERGRELPKRVALMERVTKVALEERHAERSRERSREMIERHEA